MRSEKSIKITNSPPIKLNLNTIVHAKIRKNAIISSSKFILIIYMNK